MKYLIQKYAIWNTLNDSVATGRLLGNPQGYNLSIYTFMI